MQFLSSLLGESAGALVTSTLALGVVLVLIVLGVWALKMVTSRGVSAGIGRGRNRRLTIVDNLQVDPRRQLLIVRRDNVEHLILTGGPQDVVIESGIPVEHPPLAARRPPEQPAPPPPSPLTKPEIEKLRAFVRPGAPRKSPSLRHTGLLRPVMQGEPAIIPMTPMAGDNAARGKPDSATTPLGSDGGRTAFGTGRDISDKG